MSNNIYNPIDTVNNVKLRYSPSVYQYDIEDVSQPDAGRTESGKMDKMRLGQVVRLQLEWHNVTTLVASSLLKMFNPEYLYVNYLDPMLGDYIRREFYVGNRSSPMYNASLGIWKNISFNIISRNAANFGTTWDDEADE